MALAHLEPLRALCCSHAQCQEAPSPRHICCYGAPDQDPQLPGGARQPTANHQPAPGFCGRGLVLSHAFFSSHTRSVCFFGLALGFCCPTHPGRDPLPHLLAEGREGLTWWPVCVGPYA